MQITSDRAHCAIVTNAKSRMGYAVVRSLAMEGIQVVTADFIRCSMSFFSRYSKGHFVYASPFLYPERFIQDLLTYVQCAKIAVLIPVFEEIFMVSRYREELGHHVHMAVPSYDSMVAVHNKDTLASLAAHLGIPTPKTFTCRTPAEVEEAASSFGFPLVIKPLKAAGWGSVKINSREQLLEIYPRYQTSLKTFILQEYIPGDVYGVAMLFNHGELRAKFTHKVLRSFSAFGGAPTVRISTKNSAMENLLQKLLGSLSWHGVCQADFIQHCDTGEPYLLDVNPRFWGSVFGAVMSGVNFPYLFYRMAIDGDVEPVQEYKLGVKTRWLWGDIKGLVEQIVKNKEGRISTIKDFFRHFKGNAAYDDFSLYDLLPFLVSPLYQIRGMLSQRTLNPTWGSF